MKTTIFSLLMACGVTAFGQFIPQPNAYNPDANGDSFIGVDDVIGTLALYNSVFDNGDSTVSIFETLTDPLDTLWIPENADIVHIAANGPENANFIVVLPLGIGFKSLVALVNNITGSESSNQAIRFKVQNGCDYDPNGFCEQKYLSVSTVRPQHYITIRGEGGVWYGND